MKKLAIVAFILISTFGYAVAQYQDEILVAKARKAIKSFNINTADSSYKAAMKAAMDEEDYNKIQAEWQVLEKINILLSDGSRSYDRAEYKDALKKYEDAIAAMNASPHDIWSLVKAEAYYSMGMVHYRRDDPITAADRFRDANRFDLSGEKHGKALEMVRNQAYSEGHKYLKRRDLTSAKAQYEISVAVDPTFAPGHYQLAFIAKKDGDLSAAEKHYRNAVTSDPTHFKSWFGLGNLYYEKGNNSKAIEALNRAISINASYTQAYYVLGQIYENQKNYNLAVQNLKKAIEVDKSYTLAYDLLGRIYVDQEKYELTVALLKGLTGDAASYKTYYYLAQAYNFQEQYSAGLSAASKSLSDPKRRNWAPALIEKGISLKGLDRNKEAIEAWRAAAKDARWKSVAEHLIDQLMNAGK
ncbi:MAG: tetratricopeptide repeat protein [Candidatus Marinimicrobia bacterium]|nr:tetratricopeptide repeat protein [Candidatus Neomarinimicrobiota bacterium]